LFAVARIGEQAIDDGLKCFGVRAFIGFEGFDFLRCWRESDEVEGGSADEGGSVSWFSCWDTFFFKLVVDESVDRILASVFGFGDSGIVDWLVRP
jgi:hypothetical protein